MLPHYCPLCVRPWLAVSVSVDGGHQLSKAGSSSHKSLKYCKKGGPSSPKPSSDTSRARGLISLPDGVQCQVCDRLLKNKNGLSRHMRKIHPSEDEQSSSSEDRDNMDVDETLVVDSPPKEGEKLAVGQQPAGRNGLTVNEHFEETQKLMNSLTTGTEIIGRVEDGVPCGVCLLKVERNTYGEHLGAHVEAAKLQFAYLGEMLERTAESVRNLEAGKGEKK